MSGINGNGAIPRIYQNANPLLYTFRDDNTVIQPYWVIVAQLFVFELSLRIWDRIVYGTWLLPSEFITVNIRDEIRSPPKPAINNTPTNVRRKIRSSLTVSTVYILQDYKKLEIGIIKKQKKPKFDLFDIIFDVLPLLAHSAWYCQIQSSCMSAENATVWNCYNLFGYRLYNYVFVDYASFAFTFIAKLILTFRNKEEEKPKDEAKKKWRNTLSRIIHYISLSSSIVTFFFVGALVVPYLFTNVVPMIFTYLFIVVIYIFLFTIIIVFLTQYFTFVSVIGSYVQESIFSSPSYHIFRYLRHIVLQAGIRQFPYIMSILYNFSQYLYYGEDYLQTIVNEANSRDPVTYFESIRNQTTDQILHTILTTI